MLANEFLFHKLGRFPFAFIKISLFYTAISRNERKFFISILPGTGADGHCRTCRTGDNQLSI